MEYCTSSCGLSITSLIQTLQTELFQTNPHIIKTKPHPSYASQCKTPTYTGRALIMMLGGLKQNYCRMTPLFQILWRSGRCWRA